MTRTDTIAKMWLASSHIASDMEEILGDFDANQRCKVVLTLMTFWAWHEDYYHPVRGKKWIDAIRDGL